MNHKIHAQQESRITREGPVGRKLRHFSGLEFVMRLKIVAARALRHGSWNNRKPWLGVLTWDFRGGTVYSDGTEQDMTLGVCRCNEVVTRSLEMSGLGPEKLKWTKTPSCLAKVWVEKEGCHLGTEVFNGVNRILIVTKQRKLIQVNGHELQRGCIVLTLLFFSLKRKRDLTVWKWHCWGEGSKGNI